MTMKVDVLTCGIGKLIFLALYPILERLCISPCNLDLLLNGLCVGVRHAARAVPTASNGQSQTVGLGSGAESV